MSGCSFGGPSEADILASYMQNEERLGTDLGFGYSRKKKRYEVDLHGCKSIQVEGTSGYSCEYHLTEIDDASGSVLEKNEMVSMFFEQLGEWKKGLSRVAN